MGAFLSILKGGSNESEPIDAPVDFNAKPTEKEILYSDLISITSQFQAFIDKAEGYKGCGDFIRLAISTPSKTNDENAWNAILPSVATLKAFYDFSCQMDVVLVKLLTFLCTDDPTVTFANYQASTFQLATIISFAIQFDLLKMANPSIQNDFSYYRRTVSRMKIQNNQGNIVVNDELANRMSLFFAHSNPITKLLIDSIAAAVVAVHLYLM